MKENQLRIVLDESDFEAFIQKLIDPPKDTPKLDKLVAMKLPWK